MKKSNKTINWIMVLVALVLLSGCTTASKFFNPYDDEFACPFSDPGMCTSVKKAYDASLSEEGDQATKTGQPECKSRDCPNQQTAGQISGNGTSDLANSQEIFKQRQFETIAGLIQEEDAPVVIPPEVVRILILSYTGSENEMFGFRYAYFFATEPQWMLSTANVD